MKQKDMEKLAAQDAYEYGVAQMFYGEGAGTRRKLLDVVIGDRIHDIPGYEMAFETASARLNQTELAEIAIKQRKSLDRAAKAGQNFRALKNGNMKNLSTGVFIVAGVVMVAHQTGYDKVVEAKAKELYKRAKVEVKFRWMRAQGRNVDRIF